MGINSNRIWYTVEPGFYIKGLMAMKIAIVGIHYLYYAHHSLYGSCLLIHQIAISFIS